MLSLAQNKLGEKNMAKKENDDLTGFVEAIIDSSEKKVITCHDINDALVGTYNREAVFKAMESISKQSEGKLKLIPVMRKNRVAFAIRKMF